MDKKTLCNIIIFSAIIFGITRIFSLVRLIQHKPILKPIAVAASCNDNISVSSCDASPGCAWYSCSNSCWNQGTPISTACPDCNSATTITECDARSPTCAWYYCSNSCWNNGTPLSTACPDCSSLSSIESCNTNAPVCAWYDCSNSCWPTGTENATACPAPAVCNEYKTVTTCDAHSGSCAWYDCSNSCWPRGTAIDYACPNCRSYTNITACDYRSPTCAWYDCSNSCWPTGTALDTACTPSNGAITSQRPVIWTKKTYTATGILSATNTVVSNSSEIQQLAKPFDWAGQKQLTAAINANYFKGNFEPVGWAGYGLGDVKDYGAGILPPQLVFQIDKTYKSEIISYISGTTNPNLRLAISGTKLTYNSLYTDPYRIVTRDMVLIIGNQVMLTVMPNATIKDLQDFSDFVGANNAMQLDGGFSTAFCEGSAPRFGNLTVLPVSIGLKSAAVEIFGNQ